MPRNCGLLHKVTAYRFSHPQGALCTTEGRDFFLALYRSWCHNVGSILSLCFLAEAFDHVGALLTCLANMTLSPEVVVQLDRLVFLLESSIFASLRLKLL